MDDGYAAGPAHVVFAAIARFLTRVRAALDLESSPGKLACFSPLYDLASCPHRAAMGAPIGTCDILQRTYVHGRTMASVVVGQAFGITVGGAPVGDREFEHEMMHQVGDRYVSYCDTTLDQLRSYPHHAWPLLYSCLQPDLDFWLRHVQPSAVRVAADLCDQAYLGFVAELRSTDAESHSRSCWGIH